MPETRTATMTLPAGARTAWTERLKNDPGYYVDPGEADTMATAAFSDGTTAILGVGKVGKPMGKYLWIFSADGERVCPPPLDVGKEADFAASSYEWRVGEQDYRLEIVGG